MKFSFASFFPKAFFLIVAYIWTSTIVLSLFHLLTSQAVATLSLLLTIIVVYALKRANLHVSFPRSKFALLVGSLLVLTFIQGIVSAPNTTDSMIYHLPRVMYWIQAKSIFLPTLVTSHDYMPPLAESSVMYLMLLTGNDRLAFLPQWFAGITVVCTTFLIARELVLTRREQQLSVLFVATLPILLLQSVSTQTDLFMTAFVTLSVYFALRKQIVPLALSIALGFLAKQVFVVYAVVPFLLIVPDALRLVRERFLTVVFCICIILSTLAPYIVSNMRLYGSPIGEHVTSDGRTLILTNEAMNLELFASNLARNVLQEIPIPLFGSVIERAISNDPRTTWYGSVFHVSRVFIPQEDIASAPVQMILIGSALFFLFRVGISPLQRKLLLYSLLSFLLLCVLLKWQPYNPRLHLSFLVLSMPAVVAALTRYQKMLRVFALCSVVLGFVTIFANTSHPYFSYDVVFSRVKSFAPEGVQAPQSIFLESREDQYYSARPYWREPYRNISQQLANDGVSAVSLSLFDGFTYPLMVELQRKAISIDEASSVRVYSQDSIVHGECRSTAIPYGQICVR